jgi:transcriptional regulator NrdR family protein
VICPNCSWSQSYVKDTRQRGAKVTRRRQCTKCDTRFTTEERAVLRFKPGLDAEYYVQPPTASNRLQRHLQECVAQGLEVYVHYHHKGGLCNERCHSKEPYVE